MSTEGPGVVVGAGVTEQPLALDAAVSAATSDECGAVVSFSGVIRDHDDGRSVTSLVYTSHPSADDAVRSVAEAMCREHPGVRVFVQHRVGPLEVGDVALVAAVAAAHRREAFAACSALIDSVKAEVPIWKQQHFVDGTSEWVGL